jgi:pimeloyl-ACP methyl ester carboxylesterase
MWRIFGLAAMASAALLLPLSPVNTPTRPDLIPTDITFGNASLITGRQVHFDSGISNLGNQGTSAFNVKWFVNGQEVGAYGGHSGVPAKKTVLEGNSQFDRTFNTPGTYTITFKVDVDGHVTESNENNNSRSVKIRVVGNSAEPQPQKCTQIVFIGLRGSGENPTYESEHKMGETIYRGIFQEFVQRANHAGVPVEPIGFDGEEYPAVPVYDFSGGPSLIADHLKQKHFPSVSKGVIGLTAHMKDAVRDPKNCIALAGYSQGAWVIDRYLWLHPEQKKRVSAVVLFGDPLFSPGSPVSEGSRVAKGVQRTFDSQEAWTYYNDDMKDRVRSYCQRGDPVCNFTRKNAEACVPGLGMEVRCPHYFYIAGALPRGYTEDGTAFLAERLLGQNPD